MKMKRRIVSLLLCGAMLFSLCSQSVIAEASAQTDSGTIGASGLCEHHTEHDDECGYSPATEGTPCGYVCEICDAEGNAKTATPSNVEAVTVESVQAMIDALPGAAEITEDNAGEVKAQLEAIDEAKAQLSDEELDQLDFSRYTEAAAALSGLTMMVFTADEDRPTYSGGDGTEANPWLISSVEDLQTLADTINSGNAAEIDADADVGGEGVAGNYYGYYFKQTCALDLSVIENWEPIGYSGNSNCYFAGNYDGGGYSISGMKSTGKTDDNGYATAGLFGWVAFGSVSNVHIKDADLKATGVGNYSYAGGIAGVVYGSTITNCSVSASTIESTRDKNNNCAGGIAGYSTGGTFDRCAAEGNTVKTMAYGGGFVGEVDDDYGVGKSTFTNCYVAKSTVTAFTNETQGLSFAGEFAGEMTACALTLENCFVYGNTAEIGENSAPPTLKKTGVFAANLWQNATMAPINAENCYYYSTAETPDNTGSAAAKSTEEFADGTVKNLLGDAFVQGTEHPVLAFVYPVKLETGSGTITGGNTVESYTRGVGATLPTASDITCDGYTFGGWYEDSSFSGYPVTAISSTDTGNKTFYAKWEANTYTVTVQNDGNGTGTATPASAAEGTEITLTATPNNGYQFKTWEVVSGGVTISGNKFTMPAEDVTVKATFEVESQPTKTYTVGVSASPAEGGTMNGAGTYDENTSVTVTATAHSGYKFVNWTENGADVSTDASYTFTIGADRNLVAVFEQEQQTATKYAVTVNGSYAAASGAGSYAAGDTVTISAGTRSGYTFSGWTSGDGITFADASSMTTTFTMSDKAVAVTANWEITGGSTGGVGGGTTYYTLTFETNGGSSMKAISTTYGKTIDLSGYTPTRGGYDFSGWYSDAALTQKITEIKLTGNKTVYAGWTKHNPDTGANPFTDVSESNWFYDDVMFVYEKGLMAGTTASTFAPNDTMTRAMVWTVLARMEGQSVEGGSPWYALAQSWAMNAAVSDGTRPNDSITREQLITMLYRYAGSPVVGVSELAKLGQFSDGEAVSDWAQSAMAWAVSNGILTGEDGALNPQAGATRAQVAAILMRFCQ